MCLFQSKKTIYLKILTYGNNITVSYPYDHDSSFNENCCLFKDFTDWYKEGTTTSFLLTDNKSFNFDVQRYGVIGYHIYTE